MNITLSEAAHCEHEGAYGYEGAKHQTGNQTGDELRHIAYYNYPWTYVFRCKNTDIANAMAIRQTQAVGNQHIGYSQPDRYGYKTQLEKCKGDPSKITTLCDCDCSSLLNTNVWYTLKSQGINTAITGNETTAQMPKVYLNNELFLDVTHTINMKTGTGLKKGDVLVSPGHHTAMVTEVVEDTSEKTEYKTTTVLNMRSGAGTGYSIVKVLSSGITVTATGREMCVGSAVWMEITYGGVTGWVNGTYLTAVSTGCSKTPQYVAECTKQNTVVHMKPSATSKALAEHPYLGKGNRVDVCDTKGNWRYVRIVNVWGWVHKKYLKKI